MSDIGIFLLDGQALVSWDAVKKKFLPHVRWYLNSEFYQEHRFEVECHTHEEAMEVAKILLDEEIGVMEASFKFAVESMKVKFNRPEEE